MQNETNKPTFIEVCAGAGGLSCGLIQAGFVPLLLNDNNKDCCKTLKHNHPNTQIKCCSMDEIDYSDNEGESETRGQIVKAKRLELINSTILAQKGENGEPMIVYQPQGGDAIIFRNDSLAHSEKLVVRIMGDLYKFSA
ncbi:MAG: DNA cytosine methyltransferase, partial [Crocinitomicaceae bacterium]|nr:DNA cytosine methyltransferase [Crocinitomicaceae bacterium]